MTARRKTRTITVESRSMGPTPERMRHAAGGEIKREGKTVIALHDSPLDRMLSREAIEPAQYRALMIDASLSEKPKDITVACKCGWQGQQSKLVGDRCPSCGAPFKAWP